MDRNKIYDQFWKLCSDFKNKTNMNTNYMEYMSALLYLRYYKNNEKNFEMIYKDRDNYYINIAIDKNIEKLRDEIGDKKLFSDIQFKNIVFYRNLGEKNILTIAIDQIYELCKEYDKKYVAEAYEFAIKQSAMQGDVRRTEKIFYTPKEIANTMVDMIVEKENVKIYDPMCSSGNILIKAMEKNKVEIFGEEDNIEGYNILKTRILLKKMEIQPQIYQEENEIRNIKFDCIVSNPPFSQKNWKENIEYTPLFEEYGLSENAVGDYAYVIKMIERLDDNGRIAVILPHGVLFRENEKKVRETLIEKKQIDAIIGLPENLFYGTRIPVIILVISKNRKKDTILFIDASNDYKTEKGTNILTEENQKKIIDTYHNSKNIEGYSRNVSKNEIKMNEYNLSIRKYIRKKREKTKIEEENLIKRLKNLSNEQEILEQNIKDILEVLNVKISQEKSKVENKDVKAKDEQDISKEDTLTESSEKDKSKKENIVKYKFDSRKIGQNIKKIRWERGYTQEELAERLEVSSRYMSIVERGLAGMRLESLLKICNELEVKIEELLK